MPYEKLGKSKGERKCRKKVDSSSGKRRPVPVRRRGLSVIGDQKKPKKD